MAQQSGPQGRKNESRRQRQRMVVDEVWVKGWRVDIRLRIPVDEDQDQPDPPLSSIDRMRSVGKHD